MLKKSKKSPLKPASIRKRRRNRTIGLTVLICIAIALVVWGVIYFFHIPKFLLTDIRVEGNNAVTFNDVQTVAAVELRGDYLGIFPKRNTFIYPRQTIKKKVADAFPRFESVDVSRKGLQTLDITVIEREPVALWCADSGNCFFMDKNGFIYAQAPSFSADVYPRYYGLLQENGVVGSTYSLDPSITITDMSQFIKKVGDLGPFTIDSLHAKENGEYELRLSGGGTIIFNDRQPLDKTLSNLTTVLKEADLKNVSVTEMGYIDLRFGNKVYFKAKKDAPTPIQ